MARLPKVGDDNGTWGDILNDFLQQSHGADGLLKSASVGAAQLEPNAVTNAAIADAQITNEKIADGVIANAKLAQVGEADGLATLDSSGRVDETQMPARLSDAELSAKIDDSIAGALGARVTVGPTGRDFTQIQAAIDWIGTKDSANTPYVIVVDPVFDGSTYQRFSMVGWPNQTGDWSTNRRRYISIVARSPIGTVAVKDTTGDYRTPPAEIRTVGKIKGIQFIATHDTPFTDPVELALPRRSYPVHMDFGDQDVQFEDCDLIGEHAPGAGIGFHNKETIHFLRCRLQNLADGSFGGLKDYGALFAHSGSGNNNLAQRLILEDCWFYSPYGSRAVWLSVSGAFIGCEMAVTASRNAAFCADSTPVDRDARIVLTAGSASNNDSALNAAAVVGQYTGLSLPGATTDYVTTQDATPLDITGDLEVVCKVAAADWTTGAVQGLISKWETSGNQRSYALAITQTGCAYLSWTTDGTSGTQLARTSTALIPAADGAFIWLKATLDVDNGASAHAVKFFTSSDGITWTQLGTTVTTAGVTSIYSSTAPVKLGTWSTFVGAMKLAAVVIRKGIDGPVSGQWDGRAPTPGFKDVAGNTWTIVGTGSTWAT